MAVFSSMKGKVAGIVLVGTLVTGAGAASASQFSSVLDPIVKAHLDRAAALAAFLVNEFAEGQEDGVEEHVESQFNSVSGELVGYLGGAVGNGSMEIATYAEQYKAGITAATSNYTEIGKRKIDKAVQDEVTEAKMEIHNAAIDKGTELIRNYDAAVPTIPQNER